MGSSSRREKRRADEGLLDAPSYPSVVLSCPFPLALPAFISITHSIAAMSSSVGGATLPCGGRSLTIPALLVELGRGTKTCFVANNEYLNILRPLLVEARQIRGTAKCRDKWKQFNDEYYKKAAKAVKKLLADHSYLSPMPELQSIQKGHFYVDEENYKVKRHSNEIVPLENLVAFVDGCWTQQQSRNDDNVCRCQELVDHCVKTTTFSRQFMNTFYKDCKTTVPKLEKKTPAPKRARREMEAKKPAPKEVLGELAECSDNTAQTTLTAHGNSTATMKVGEMSNSTTATSNTSSHNTTTHNHFNFASPVPTDSLLDSLRAESQYYQLGMVTYANSLRKNGIPLPEIEIPDQLRPHLRPPLVSSPTNHRSEEEESPSTPPRSKKVKLDPNFSNLSIPMSANSALLSIGERIFDSASTKASTTSKGRRSGRSNRK